MRSDRKLKYLVMGCLEIAALIISAWIFGTGLEHNSPAVITGGVVMFILCLYLEVESLGLRIRDDIIDELLEDEDDLPKVP
jgi:hypothetical protein